MNSTPVARKFRRTADNHSQSKPTRADLHGVRAAAPFRRELRLLALFRLPLSQPDAGTAAVLVDELDAGCFQHPLRRPAHRRTLHSTLAYSQTDADFAGFIVGEMNAGLF